MDNKFEQDMAKLRDTLPRIWWAIYSGCIETGFTPSESIALTQTWIMSQAPKGNS